MSFLENIKDFISELRKYLGGKIPQPVFFIPTIGVILGLIALTVSFRTNREVVIFILWATFFLGACSFLVFLVQFSCGRSSIPGKYRFPISIRLLTILTLATALTIEILVTFNAVNNGFVNIVFYGTQTPTPTNTLINTRTSTSTAIATQTITTSFTKTFTVTTTPTATSTKTLIPTLTRTKKPTPTATLSKTITGGLTNGCIPSDKWSLQDFKSPGLTLTTQEKCVDLSSKGISGIFSGIKLEVGKINQDIVSLSYPLKEMKDVEISFNIQILSLSGSTTNVHTILAIGLGSENDWGFDEGNYLLFFSNSQKYGIGPGKKSNYCQVGNIDINKIYPIKISVQGLRLTIIADEHNCKDDYLSLAKPGSRDVFRIGYQIASGDSKLFANITDFRFEEKK